MFHLNIIFIINLLPYFFQEKKYFTDVRKDKVLLITAIKIRAYSQTFKHKTKV